MTPKILDHWGSIATHSWFAECCGAKYYKSLGPVQLERVKNYRGIVVAVGKKGVPQDTGKCEIVHVETKNGPLTIGMRYEW